MKYVLFILLSFLFVSCMTQKKQLKITERYLYEHPEKLAEECAEHYPVKAIDSSVIIKAIDSAQKEWSNNDYRRMLDSILNSLDTGTDTSNLAYFESGYHIGYEVAKAECKKNPLVITKTEIKTVTVRDRAQEEHLNFEIQRITAEKDKIIAEQAKAVVNAQKDRDKAEDKLKSKNKTLLYLWIVIGALGLFTILKFVAPLFKRI